MADNYEQYSREELLRLLRERDRKPKFGLVWERNEVEHDKSLNDDFVALDLDPGLSCGDPSIPRGQWSHITFAFHVDGIAGRVAIA